MTVAALLNTPTDTNTLNQFSFAHMAHHRDCIRAVVEQKKVTLAEYSLDPMPVQDLNQWIYWHQVMHNQMNATLGTSGYDLTGLDVNDQQDFSAWLDMNENEHYQWATILGVG